MIKFETDIGVVLEHIMKSEWIFQTVAGPKNHKKQTRHDLQPS
jgi:hypothetical protein